MFGQLRERRTLRGLLESQDLVVAPGAWDGVSATVAERLGFDAVLSPGWAVAAALGMPDAELYSKADNVAAVRTMSGVTAAAIVADIDNGYGNAVGVFQTVREFERAGATAVLLEDQVSPKRCDYLVDHLDLYDIDTASNKIRAACDARQDESTIIIARTDARGEEIFRRAEAYAEAGAELICPIAVSEDDFGPESWALVHEKTGVGLMSAFVPGYWQERVFTPEVCKQVGIRLVTLGLHTLYAATTALYRSMEALQEGKWATEVFAGDMSHAEFSDLIGMDDVLRMEREYASKE